MAKPPVHTVPHGDGWANRRAGGDRVSKTFDTKAEAQAAGEITTTAEAIERAAQLVHLAD